jgi:DNA-binding transcriptional MerR regulator
MNELEKLRGTVFRGVEELAAAAGSLVEQYTQEPARGNVRLGITERIVRHYLSEGLLGSPNGHSGPAVLFNYGNLLRLLAVKKLLADHWSVVKIREFMAALDTKALEELVTIALTSSSTKVEARAEIEKKVGGGQRYSVTGQPADAHSKQVLPPPSMTLAAAPPLASLAVESARRAERASAEWIEIATGLEVKIRRSFRVPSNEQERERLITRFLSVIEKKSDEKQG